MMKLIFISMRPLQWYKNVLLFVGLVYSLNGLNFQSLLTSVLAFIIFCVLSGSEYIINDVIDKKKDQLHSEKSKRPVASGKLNGTIVAVIAVVLTILALIGAYIINIQFFIVSIIFISTTTLYSFWLKKLIIVDLLAIAINFTLRAIAGCLVIQVPVSPWITICAFLLALLLVLGKRRSELFVLEDNAKNHRGVLDFYTAPMLEITIPTVSGSLIVSYSLYTFFMGNIWMMVTIPFVVYGILRYLYLMHSQQFGGVPEKIFKDKSMDINFAFFVLTSFVVIYW